MLLYVYILQCTGPQKASQVMHLDFQQQPDIQKSIKIIVAYIRSTRSLFEVSAVTYKNRGI